jgi:hypothetical protein
MVQLQRAYLDESRPKQLMGAEFILIILNLIIGIGFAIPLALVLRRVNTKPTKFIVQFIFLIAIYLTESIALAMGMGIPIINIALAFIWGVIFGARLRSRILSQQLLKVSFFLALYSSLPVISFIVIPILALIDGRNIVSITEGINFGIPEVPYLSWLLNTILGFYATLVIGALLLKTLVTTGEVKLFIHSRVNRK